MATLTVCSLQEIFSLISVGVKLGPRWTIQSLQIQDSNQRIVGYAFLHGYPFLCQLQIFPMIFLLTKLNQVEKS